MKKFTIKWREFKPCHLQLSRWTTVSKTVKAESESKLFEWFQSMKELSYWEDHTSCELLPLKNLNDGIMITARIETQVRTMPVACDNDRNKAISALQDAVYKLTEEDGRCKFVVDENGHAVYHWFYQPTFRKESKIVKKERPVSPYILSLCIYVLLSGKELCYDNLYHEAEDFESAVKAHQFMKERGWSKYDYRIVYEYIVEARDHDCIYGTGLGFTKAEAKGQLNCNLKYYHIEVTKNGTIKNI